MFSRTFSLYLFTTHLYLYTRLYYSVNSIGIVSNFVIKYIRTVLKSNNVRKILTRENTSSFYEFVVSYYL
jgi:hypothetical protein